MSSYQVCLNGTPVHKSFYDQLAALEIEENADLPGAIAFTLPIAESNGDLTWVSDPTIGPFSNVTVTVTPDGSAPAQCIFDGYVLSHKVHAEPGITSSTVQVWGRDASVLMALEDKVNEWSGMTDGAVANQIFANYGFASGPHNTDDDSPVHDPSAHTLMQRASDWDFLRRLGRRTGKWCRVACRSVPGARTGYFAAPDLGADPVAQIVLNDPQNRSVTSLELNWDVERPTSVHARQASLTNPDQDGTDASTSDSGLPVLGAPAQTLAAFSTQTFTAMLTAAADDTELPALARAVLRDAGWWLRAEGTADLAVLKTVLRVGDIVGIQGMGTMFSGNYVVWTVRHNITNESHSMAFTLVRNAVGHPPASAGAGAVNGAPSLPSLP
ncbi:MAG TPA: hypothetical protein VFN61_11920 [Acidimicrobiales bacterium]|nr:hypothetical protein [Acidimicrobiales bacterium]